VDGVALAEAEPLDRAMGHFEQGREVRVVASRFSKMSA
jgi:hypothetical protein